MRHAMRRWHEAREALRPVHRETRAALARRWAELPAAVRTPNQALGRHALGCEGTHGVFPRCNLSCTPCYHSRDANRVATDGAHTLAAVRAQLATLRRHRGPHAHAQLIGGEVSLLEPDDHAAALQVMREYGREPMSMSHGDFDYGYLRAVALGPDGRPRLRRLSFAAHFDTLMTGRRDHARPPDERSLQPARAGFVEMFQRLRREHGVRFFLAHTMTVSPRNVDEIAEVVRATRGFGMFSFQPAARIGDERRWRAGAVTPDAVWREIERGAGTRLPYLALVHGDTRCNRTTYGFYCGCRYFPILDDTDPRDLRLRDAFLDRLGGVDFAGAPPGLMALRVVRVLVAHPSVPLRFAGWTVRTVRRVGLSALLRHGVRPVTFVMHSFMDADEVAPVWAAMCAGKAVTDPAQAAVEQRLRSCSYAMAHPDTDELVPACVQHSVLDPAENAELRRLLPLVTRTPG